MNEVCSGDAPKEILKGGKGKILNSFQDALCLFTIREFLKVCCYWSEGVDLLTVFSDVFGSWILLRMILLKLISLCSHLGNGPPGEWKGV